MVLKHASDAFKACKSYLVGAAEDHEVRRPIPFKAERNCGVNKHLDSLLPCLTPWASSQVFYLKYCSTFQSKMIFAAMMTSERSLANALG